MTLENEFVDAVQKMEPENDILDLLFSKKPNMTIEKTEFDLALEEVKKFYGEEAPLPKVLETLSNTVDALVDENERAEDVEPDVDNAVEHYLDNHLEEKVNDIAEKYLQDNLDDALKDSDFGIDDKVNESVKEYLDDNLEDRIKEVDIDFSDKIESAVSDYCTNNLEELVKDNIDTHVIESAVTSALEEDSDIVDNAVAAFFTSRRSSNALDRAIENYLDNQDEMINGAIDQRLEGIVTDKLSTDPHWFSDAIDEAIERALTKKRTSATAFMKDQLAAILGPSTVADVEAKLFEVLDARLEKVVEKRILNVDELVMKLFAEKIKDVRGYFQSWF